MPLFISILNDRKAAVTVTIEYGPTLPIQTITINPNQIREVRITDIAYSTLFYVNPEILITDTRARKKGFCSKTNRFREWLKIESAISVRSLCKREIIVGPD